MTVGKTETMAWSSGAALRGTREPRTAAQVLAFSPPADTLRDVGGWMARRAGGGTISEGDLGGQDGG